MSIICLLLLAADWCLYSIFYAEVLFTPVSEYLFFVHVHDAADDLSCNSCCDQRIGMFAENTRWLRCISAYSCVHS